MEVVAIAKFMFKKNAFNKGIALTKNILKIYLL